jgi:hypothetical protein
VKAINFKEYKIEIINDSSYTLGSADNLNQYDFIYPESESKNDNPVSKHGIRIFKNEIEYKSALIVGFGGATGINDNSVLFDNDRLFICCTDTVFCLTIPELELKWYKQLDTATCFQIFKIPDGLIIHGELEITKVENDGNIVWKQSGKDIFVSDSENAFVINKDHILTTDWNGEKYRIDFDGKCEVI